MFRHEHLLKMKYNIWTVPREAFCWLNENKVVITSTKFINNEQSESHCQLLDIVSSVLTYQFDN